MVSYFLGWAIVFQLGRSMKDAMSACFNAYNSTKIIPEKEYDYVGISLGFDIQI